jgi:uncharacterized OB-fold protein
MESEWRLQSGRARIWSFVVAHPPLLAPFEGEAPYPVVLVELDEDPLIRLVGNVVRQMGDSISSVSGDALAIGAPVRALFGTSLEGFPVPLWVLEPGGAPTAGR